MYTCEYTCTYGIVQIRYRYTQLHTCNPLYTMHLLNLITLQKVLVWVSAVSVGNMQYCDYVSAVPIRTTGLRIPERALRSGEIRWPHWPQLAASCWRCHHIQLQDKAGSSAGGTRSIVLQAIKIMFICSPAHEELMPRSSFHCLLSMRGCEYTTNCQSN
jgi:hypothetical protein